MLMEVTVDKFRDLISLSAGGQLFVDVKGSIVDPNTQVGYLWFQMISQAHIIIFKSFLSNKEVIDTCVEAHGAIHASYRTSEDKNG